MLLKFVRKFFHENFTLQYFCTQVFVRIIFVVASHLRVDLILFWPSTKNFFLQTYTKGATRSILRRSVRLAKYLKISQVNFANVKRERPTDTFPLDINDHHEVFIFAQSLNFCELFFYRFALYYIIFLLIDAKKSFGKRRFS